MNMNEKTGGSGKGGRVSLRLQLRPYMTVRSALLPIGAGVWTGVRWNAAVPRPPVSDSDSRYNECGLVLLLVGSTASVPGSKRR